MELRKMCLIINGAERMFICDPAKDTLADVLRRLGLTGTKIGCGTGVCGACSVLIDGKVVRSCVKKIKDVSEFSSIITIEGIGTPNHLDPLQLAWIVYGGVQCGFCTPGFIVSAHALLLENDHPTREEVRAWFQKHRNVCRCTGYKPLVDAVMAASLIYRNEQTMEDLAAKIIYMDGSSIYGSKYPRPSALAKVCGACDFGDDIKFKMPPGTVHLALVQARVRRAVIRGIDFSQAEHMEGVIKVITAQDIKGTNRIFIPNTHPYSKSNGSERPIINDNKVFRYGDVVAVVAADNETNARAAAAAVKLDLEELPANKSYLETVLPGAPRVHEDIDNVYIEQPVYKGELADEIINSSAYAVEGSFYASREPHLSIEADTAQGYWDEDGMLTLHCKSQSLEACRQAIAKGLDLDTAKIRIVENPTGASFGYACSPGTIALVGAAVIALNRPATLTLNYEEHQIFSGKRAPAYMNGRLACDASGKLMALEFDCGIDHGPYSEQSGPLVTKFARFMGFTYNIPNVTGLCRMAATNHSFGVAYRGFGSPQAYTCTESLMDMLAEKIGMDPFDFRYINVAHPGDTNINSFAYKQYPMTQIMDTMRPYYEQAKSAAAAADTLENRRGVGIVCGAYNVGLHQFDKAEVALELNPDGSVTNYNGWEDQGQGGDIGSLSLTHEALRLLGLWPNQIHLVMNDTKICPNTGVAAASRSHFMAGGAIIDAANKLMDAMRKEDGSFRTYDEMKAENIPTKYLGVHELSHLKLCGLDPDTGVGDPSPAYMYASFLSEVEVNTTTGNTKVLSITAVVDIGKIGNRLAVEGQAYGGLSHCVGYALSEEFEDVRKHVNMYAAGIPYIQDIPDDIRLIFIENPRENGPFGSSGCSEIFQSCGHMAVINGIKNAAGVRIYDLPARPAKVKKALEALARGEQITPGKYYLGTELYERLEELREEHRK